MALQAHPEPAQARQREEKGKHGPVEQKKKEVSSSRAVIKRSSFSRSGLERARAVARESDPKQEYWEAARCWKAGVRASVLMKSAKLTAFVETETSSLSGLVLVLSTVHNNEICLHALQLKIYPFDTATRLLPTSSSSTSFG